MRYVKVALNLPLNQLFCYSVPEKFYNQVGVGVRVLIPFKKKRLIGFVVEEIKEGELEDLRDIINVVDELPPLSKNLSRLGKWISEYYCCSLGQALHSVVLIQHPLRINKTSLNKGVHPLTRKSGVVSSFLKEGRVALFWMEGWKERIGFYLELVEGVLEGDQQVILIVPEVNCIPLLQEKIRTGYRDGPGVFHSKLTPRQRYVEWQRMKEGKTKLVIGTRSAVFAPLPHLGLVIIEEEENLSYKQIEVPRYHTREVAIKRGEMENFPVALFTQSPSLESWWQVKRGNYKLIKIPRKGRSFRSTEIVDLRKEKDRIFSTTLKEAVEQAIRKDEPVLLFLNRRGYANFLLCRECGEVLRCPDCNIGLTLHLKGKLICHYCGYEEDAPSSCPFCGGTYLRQMGLGTEQLEIEAKKVFSGASIRRADLDIINSPLAYRELLDDFKENKVNLLIGTGLIIKEEILQRARLVGIVLIDTLLNLPDFRAGERVFQILMKIKNLITKDGRLIIQTYNPNYYALTTVKEGQAQLFYGEEMNLREELGYPPYLSWARILLEGKVKSRVGETARKIREELDREEINFLGPSPCPFRKIRGRYRYHLMLRDKDSAKLREIFERKIRPLSTYFHNVKVVIDVDPLRTI